MPGIDRRSFHGSSRNPQDLRKNSQRAGFDAKIARARPQQASSLEVTKFHCDGFLYQDTRR